MKVYGGLEVAHKYAYPFISERGSYSKKLTGDATKPADNKLCWFPAYETGLGAYMESEMFHWEEVNKTMYRTVNIGFYVPDGESKKIEEGKIINVDPSKLFRAVSATIQMVLVRIILVFLAN